MIAFSFGDCASRLFGEILWDMRFFLFCIHHKQGLQEMMLPRKIFSIVFCLICIIICSNKIGHGIISSHLGYFAKSCDLKLLRNLAMIYYAQTQLSSITTARGTSSWAQYITKIHTQILYHCYNLLSLGITWSLYQYFQCCVNTTRTVI